MTLQECTELLTPLALALRAEMDAPTFRAYHRVLKDVPVGLADRALSDLSRAGLEFMPTAFAIQAAAEKARRQLLALNPYDGCAECEEQRGFRTILGRDGQKTVEPCPCKGRYRQRLESLGVLEPVAALPGEAGVGVNEPVYPTVEQLPAPLRQRLRAVAGQKALR